MKKGTKKVFAWVMTFALLLSLVPSMGLTALADGNGVSYRYPVYNKTDGTFYENASSGIKEWQDGTCNSYTTVTSSTTAWGTQNETSWYVADGTVNISNTVTVTGNVHLILKDGCNLTTENIVVSGDANSLTIYGQSDGTSMGQLKAASTTEYVAGIGGTKENPGNNITINGGQITATAEMAGAGIGGGYKGNGNNITINGGQITATATESGAGIGGGYKGNGSNITINGGVVTATGGRCNTSGGAGGTGIGGGGVWYSEKSSEGYGDNIIINGGNVTAAGEGYAAGIGGSMYCVGKNITISGGNVIAKGDSGASGIGNGNQCSDSASNITVATALLLRADNSNHPATVIENDGNDLASSLNGKQYAAVGNLDGVSYLSPVYKDPAIGSTSGLKEMETKTCTVYATVTASVTIWHDGWYVVSGDVTINSQVTVSGHVHLILTDGCSLTTKNINVPKVSGDLNSLTIYGQSDGNNVGILTATATYTEEASGIGGLGAGGGANGNNGNITINGGKVTATGGRQATGIGGGYRGIGSNITINGGEVTANGGKGEYNNSCYYSGGAGIGGGGARPDHRDGKGENIIINGGKVTATGGEGSNNTCGGAGIGCGGYCYCKNIIINGGEVTANGGTSASGIGNGGSSNTAASDIKVATALVLKADGNDPPTTVIANTGGDLADSLNDKRYATVHTHTYTVDGTTITKNPCTGCTTEQGGTATIAAPTDLTWDGTARSATVTLVGNVTQLEVTTTYSQGETSLGTTAPSDPGSYTASITMGDKTASVNYRILPACSYSIALKDNISMNFYVKVPEGFNVNGYSVRVTFDGIPAEYSLTDKTTEDSTDIYKFTVATIYSYQMTFPVKFEVLYDGTPIQSTEKSVREYCKAQIDDTGSATDLVALCNAVLQYGADAQRYFDGKTYGNNIPYQVFPEGSSGVYADEDITRVTDTTKPTNPATVNGSLSGFSNFAVSLILGNETSLKFYFNYTGTLDELKNGYTFSCTGSKTVKPPVSEGGNQYSVTVPAIKASELGTNYVLTITDGNEATMSITYSAFSYAAAKWNAEDTKLVDLCKSLVNYGEKAADYFENQNQN